MAGPQAAPNFGQSMVRRAAANRYGYDVPELTSDDGGDVLGLLALGEADARRRATDTQKRPAPRDENLFGDGAASAAEAAARGPAEAAEWCFLDPQGAAQGPRARAPATSPAPAPRAGTTGCRCASGSRRATSR